MIHSPAAPRNSGPPPMEAAPDLVVSTARYAQRFAGPVGEYFLRVQTAIVLEMIGELDSRTVLDVGGGHGQLAAPLVAAGLDVIVLGSDSRCGERLQLQLPSDSYHFVTGSLLDMPLADNSVDIAAAFRLLAHVDRWQKLLAELCRVARRAVIVEYPRLASVNALSPWLLPLKRKLEGDTRDYRCFRTAHIAAALERRGFVPRDCRCQFLLPMVLHRKLGSARWSQRIETVARRTGLTARWGSPAILVARSVPVGNPAQPAKNP